MSSSINNRTKVVRAVLEGISTEHPLVLDDPEPAIVLTNLGDSSVDFAVRAWTKTEDHWAVRSDLLESAKTELEAAGCNIPYPQTDVHLHHFQVIVIIYDQNEKSI